MARALEVVVVAAFAAGLWILTLSSFPKDDVSLAIGCGIVVGLAATIGRRAIRGDWHPRLTWLRWLRVLPVSIVADTVTVFSVAARRLLRADARSREVRWRLPADSRAGTRRAREALAALIVSATPATVVVDADPDKRMLLVHQLGAGPEFVRREVAP